MKNIYVLLVGINEYPDPISSLDGCIKDLDNIEAYLEKTQLLDSASYQTLSIPDSPLSIRKQNHIHICRLEDQQATYQNISTAFERFLGQASSDDIVWFHFSGHGTQTFTAKEFYQSIQRKGKDQSLVCYFNNDTDQPFLTNQEIAVLLEQIATKGIHGNSKTAPHIIVSLDCCHSGKRSTKKEGQPDMKTRQATIQLATDWEDAFEKGLTRDLASYANGYFLKQWERNKQFSIPYAPYVLLSACKSTEKAGDLSQGGVFSQGLLKTLSDYQGKINYADLFGRARSNVKAINREQTPQFETFGDFDPYTQFLDGSPNGTPDRYLVFQEHGSWQVQCGALNGLPSSSEQAIQLEIQDKTETIIGQAEVEAVGIEKSRIRFVGKHTAQEGKMYEALIRFLPVPPIYVQLQGKDSDAIEHLKQAWDHAYNLVPVDGLSDDIVPELAIQADNDQYDIIDLEKGEIVYRCEALAQNAERLLDKLKKIAKWKRLIELDNPSSDIRDLFEFRVGVVDKDKRTQHYTEEEIRLHAHPDTYFLYKDGKSIYTYLKPEISVKGGQLAPSQEFHIYVYFMRANYSISSKESGEVYRKKEFLDKDEVTFSLWKKNYAWGLSPNDQQSTSYLKVIISTVEFQYQQLLQAGLEDRSFTFDEEDVMNELISPDWCCFTHKITFSRKP